MTDKDKIKKYLRREMKKLNTSNHYINKWRETSFHFCWSQAKFDVLMDIDRALKIGAFYKKRKLK